MVQFWQNTKLNKIVFRFDATSNHVQISMTCIARMRVHWIVCHFLIICMLTLVSRLRNRLFFNTSQSSNEFSPGVDVRLGGPSNISEFVVMSPRQKISAGYSIRIAKVGTSLVQILPLVSARLVPSALKSTINIKRQ